MANKLVVVLGATGHQGGSVVTALLNHGGYSIRGLTRNTESLPAKDLAAKGVEMVQASLIDKSSLVAAFRGAYAKVYAITLPFTGVNEDVMGRNIVDACRANNVPLLVLSSLPSSLEVSNGKFNVQLMEEKCRVPAYASEVGQPTVVFYLGAFCENLLQHMGRSQLQPVSADRTKWQIFYPIVPASVPQPLSYISADVGPSALAVIDRWEDPAARERLTKAPIVVCSFMITGEEMEQTIARVTGKEVKYVPIQVPEPMKTMFDFCAEVWYPDELPPPVLKDLGVKFHTFEDYVREEVVPFMAKQ
ncbi:NADP-binding protein [Dacryopinax primogenitus]|uniref:NADP-binding protein n=1 Tax=Dacryopinax primogenitus (strain DJM 731) TaxID=1858805 RepID=M5FZS3_DACPD|nr:NADP-binding protein [Dacryopinax primogenitus]EJU01390.1 NADP-binding protein [Dacryopinax primogenitus]